MKKIIRLTESDLNKIVQKILKEQGSMFGTAGTNIPGFRQNDIRTPQYTSKPSKENINPKGLKLGDGGNKNPKQIQDVNILQQKLINLGLLKTPSGKPTGYFGDLTKNALDQYNKVTTTNTAAPNALSSTTTQSSGQSWLQGAKEFCASPFKRIQLLAQTISGKLTFLPPHWRAFMSFLLGRTETIRADFFTPEEINVIRDRINSYFPSNSKCVRNKKCSVSFYKNTDWAKVKSGEQTVVNPGLAEAIGYTIGNGQVEDKGNTYVIKDIYDFNNFKNNPKAYSIENAPKTIKAAIEKIVCGNYIQGIEELASFKQSKGYNGIPVEIEVPKTT